MPGKEPFWTEDRVRILREMHAQMFSPRSIAETLGTTRNAILGKSNRLKLRRQIKRAMEPTVARIHVRRSPLPDCGCQWDVDGEWCGKEVTPGRPYCQKHLDLAYIQPQPKLDVDFLVKLSQQH